MPLKIEEALLYIREAENNVLPAYFPGEGSGVAAALLDIYFLAWKHLAAVIADHRVTLLAVAEPCPVADIAGVKGRPDDAVGRLYQKIPDRAPIKLVLVVLGLAVIKQIGAKNYFVSCGLHPLCPEVVSSPDGKNYYRGGNGNSGYRGD